ncbi:hypothetical protein GX586_08025 [bacterium]|nr:hypothetical protein [bacterium]
MSAEHGKKIIGIGLATIDQLICWQSVNEPVLGNTVTQYDMQGGGMTATALVAAARLGGSAEFWGVVGDDVFGRLIIEGLKREGVGVTHLRRVKGQEGPVVLVCIDAKSGERHFLRGKAFYEWQGRLGSPKSLDGAGCILVDQFRMNNCGHILSAARSHGIPIVGDMSCRCPFLPEVDIAVLSSVHGLPPGCGDDAHKACRAIRTLGPHTVVITLGAHGLVAYNGSEFIKLPAYKVDTVDTTGAGDTFHGAFCFGLVNGLPLKLNLAFSSAVAALKCMRLGGRAGIPSLHGTLDFLKERDPDALGQIIEAAPGWNDGMQ